MSNTIWGSNDLAKAYDDKYTILEEARIEYDRAVRAFLEVIAAQVQAGHLSPEIEQIGRTPQIVEDKPGSSGRTQLNYPVSIAGAESGLLVSAWFSSAWDNVPGYIYVAMHAPSLEPWRAGQLRSLGQSRGWASGRNAIQDGPMSDAAGIYAEAVELSDPNAVLLVADTVRRFLLLAHGLALELKAQRDLELRMEELLIRTQGWLNSPDALPEFKDRLTAVGDWKGQRYLQLWLVQGQPGFWLGHHLERGTIMFGHNPPFGRDFEARMRDELRDRPGCESFERYHNEPSGTVFGREALLKATDAVILQAMREAYESFVKVFSAWTK